jgi:hypothetical protein
LVLPRIAPLAWQHALLCSDCPTKAPAPHANCRPALTWRMVIMCLVHSETQQDAEGCAGIRPAPPATVPSPRIHPVTGSARQLPCVLTPTPFRAPHTQHTGHPQPGVGDLVDGCPAHHSMLPCMGWLLTPLHGLVTCWGRVLRLWTTLPACQPDDRSGL